MTLSCLALCSFNDPQIQEKPFNARIERIDDNLYFIIYNGHYYATDNLYHLYSCPLCDDRFQHNN